MPDTMERKSRKKADATDAGAYETINFRPTEASLPHLKQIMRREYRNMSNVVTVLIEEALIARGLIKPVDQR